MLTWRPRRSPTQWRWEPPSTCVFLEVLPDSVRPYRPAPARHGPSVPQPLHAPAAAAAAGTPGPLAFRGRLPGPSSAPRPPVPPSLVVPPALLSSPLALLPRKFGSRGPERPKPAAPWTRRSGSGGERARLCPPPLVPAVGAPRCRLWGLRFGRGIGEGRSGACSRVGVGYGKGEPRCECRGAGSSGAAPEVTQEESVEIKAPAGWRKGS